MCPGQDTRLGKTQHRRLGQGLHRPGAVDQRAELGQVGCTHGIGHHDHEEQTAGSDAKYDRDSVVDYIRRQARVDPQVSGYKEGHGTQNRNQQHQQHALDDTFQRSQRLLGLRPVLEALDDQPLAAHLLGLRDSSTRVAETAGIDLVAGNLGDAVGVAAEHRLVHDDLTLAGDLPVHYQLVARTDHQHVTLHDLVEVHAADLGLADDSGLGSRRLLYLSQAPLGEHLLADVENDVQQQGPQAQQRVQGLAQQQLRASQRDQVQVENGADVLTDHPPYRALGLEMQGVVEALHAPCFGLGLGQAFHLQHRHRFGWGRLGRPPGPEAPGNDRREYAHRGHQADGGANEPLILLSALLIIHGQHASIESSRQPDGQRPGRFVPSRCRPLQEVNATRTC